MPEHREGGEKNIVAPELKPEDDILAKLEASGFFKIGTPSEQSRFLRDFVEKNSFLIPELFTASKSYYEKFKKWKPQNSIDTLENDPVAYTRSLIGSQIRNILDYDISRGRVLDAEKVKHFDYTDWSNYYKLIYGTEGAIIASKLLRFSGKVNDDFLKLSRDQQLKIMVEFLGQDIYRILDSGGSNTLSGVVYLTDAFLNSNGRKVPFKEILAAGLPEAPSKERIFELAVLSKLVYSNLSENSTPTGINMKEDEQNIVKKYDVLMVHKDKETGFYGAVFRDKENPSKLVLAVRGSDEILDWTTSNISLFFKDNPIQLASLLELLDKLEHKVGPDIAKMEISGTGHSLGGALIELLKRKRVVVPEWFKPKMMMSVDSPGISSRGGVRDIPHFAITHRGFIGNFGDHTGGVVPVATTKTYGSPHRIDNILQSIRTMPSDFATVNFKRIQEILPEKPRYSEPSNQYGMVS